jgi:2-polyprenyl-6-methoxyphenol hydroxylase-like FAD-dependent oxidoreductase
MGARALAVIDPSTSTPHCEVLIVGAGPSGLVLALWLTRLGISVRIIDKTAEPGTTSRALAVQARTLELYRQLGFAADLVERGLKFTAVNMWVRGQHAARAVIGDIGRGLSPFPYVLSFPQDEHEQLLIEHLSRCGVKVERNTALVGFVERGERVVARLLQDGVESELETAYIAGCDGAHSTVREVLGIGFPGGTYNKFFYVADAEFAGPVSNRELHVALDQADFVAVFPMKGEHTGRLIGTVKGDSEDQRQNLTWRDVSQTVMARMKITVDRVHWFSTYHVHHRVADSLRRGRAFLVGDAAHIHSPVGGQGMNTGIGDAVNLSWKLAGVLRNRADPAILDTYEPERIAFARRLVATTDRTFTFVTKDGAVARLVRLDLVPRLAGALMNHDAVKRFLFRTVSQTLLAYHHSSLSEGKAGSVRSGDRLPWIPPDHAGDSDNFTPLSSLDWQVHVYGEAQPDLAQTCAARRLPLHSFRWSDRMREVGLERGATYLVRPDGYVALADSPPRAANLERYLDARRLRFDPATADRSTVGCA